MDFRNDKGQIVRATQPLTRAGGEGQVFLIDKSPDLLAKIYSKPQEPEKVKKLRHQVQLGIQDVRQIAAWPIELLFDCNNPNLLRGIVIPRVNGKEIHKLYGPSDRNIVFPGVSWDYLIHVAANCAIAFETLHQNDICMADVNEGNLLVKPDGQVGLIDCDSYQIKNGNGYFLCDVGIAMWTPPELQGVNFRGVQRTQNHDRFGLAVLIFHLLFMGRHPFAGIPTGPDPLEIEGAIKKFLFALSPQTWSRGVKAPPFALKLSAIPPRLANLFERAFLQGSSQPDARPAGHEWAAELKLLLASLKKSCLDPGHKFWNGLTSCPWCEIAGSGGPNFFISVALHHGTSNLNQDFSAFWAQIEKILASALIREQVVVPSIGQAAARPLNHPRPQPFTLVAPVAPVKPSPLARPQLPSPQLPLRPTPPNPVPLPDIPLGPSEKLMRISFMGLFFFFLLIVACMSWDLVAAACGAGTGIFICLVLAVMKLKQAKIERERRQTQQTEARNALQAKADAEFAVKLGDYQSHVDSMTKQHASALARAELEYQHQWLQLDQSFQSAYNKYLKEQRAYESALAQYQDRLKYWEDECRFRKDTELLFRQTLNQTLERQKEIIASFADYSKNLMPPLEEAKRQFEKSKADEIADMRKLHQKRQEIQLQQFLKNRLIRDADIPNIKSGRKAKLSAYGIGSAADISANMNVPGFGQSLIQDLMGWRRSCEAGFRYNPNLPLPPAEVNPIKIRHAQIRQRALVQVREAAAQLDARHSQTRNLVSQGKLEILKLTRDHAQAIADLGVI